MLACTLEAPCVCVLPPQDQTGTMGAAIHSSALQQQPQLGPGCVLLLQSVSVLTPNPGSCYLAVTADNIAKVRWATTIAWAAWLDAGPGCRPTDHNHSCSAGGPAPLLPATGIHTYALKHAPALQGLGCLEYCSATTFPDTCAVWLHDACRRCGARTPQGAAYATQHTSQPPPAPNTRSVSTLAASSSSSTSSRRHPVGSRSSSRHFAGGTLASSSVQRRQLHLVQTADRQTPSSRLPAQTSTVSSMRCQAVTTQGGPLPLRVLTGIRETVSAPSSSRSGLSSKGSSVLLPVVLRSALPLVAFNSSRSILAQAAWRLHRRALLLAAPHSTASSSSSGQVALWAVSRRRSKCQGCRCAKVCHNMTALLLLLVLLLEATHRGQAACRPQQACRCLAVSRVRDRQL